MPGTDSLEVCGVPIIVRCNATEFCMKQRRGSSLLIAVVLESGVKTPIDLYGNSAGLAPNAFESPTGFPYTLIYPVYSKGQFQSLMDAIGIFK